MKNKIISVIIPTYNGEKYIEKAVRSVLGQTYKNLELIIVDDGSTDTTSRIIKALQEKDQRIQVVKNEGNLGFVKSLNRGLEKSIGSHIARIDDDDEWIDSGKLEKQINFLKENPDHVLVGGGLISIDKNGKKFDRRLLPEKDEEIRKLILMNNCFGHSAVVFLKEAAEKVGNYDEEFGFFADWDLWLKLGEIGKMHNLQEYVMYYLDKEMVGHYKGRDIQRRKLIKNIKLRLKHRDYYPGLYKSILLAFGSYLYSFIPFKIKLKLLFNIKVLI